MVTPPIVIVKGLDARYVFTAQPGSFRCLRVIAWGWLSQTSDLHIGIGHDPNCLVVTVTLFEYVLAAPSGRQSLAAHSAVLYSTTEPYGTMSPFIIFRSINQEEQCKVTQNQIIVIIQFLFKKIALKEYYKYGIFLHVYSARVYSERVQCQSELCTCTVPECTVQCTCIFSGFGGFCLL